MDQFVRANAVFSKFSRNYMELKKGLPIRPSEMGVLNILTETPPPHTSVLLAEMLGVSKPMITAHLSALLEKGYIIKEQSSVDKRAFYILPTEKALDLVERVKKETAQQLGQMAAALGEERFDILIELLREADCVLEREKMRKEGN